MHNKITSSTNEHGVYLTAHTSRKAEAADYCKRFNLPSATPPGKAAFRLYLNTFHLELQDLSENSPGPIFVDFTDGKAQQRRASMGKQQPLPRAIGIKSNHYPSIIDATAGLGRDAFVLAALGCPVTMIERSAVFAALLADGLARAALNIDIAGIAEHMQLIHTDSNQYLTGLDDTQKPDVIYMDPMYPHRTKSALVKKEMRYARAIVGEDPDAATLLKNSLPIAKERVVVKRPGSAEPLPGFTPSTQISGKTTRYDVYVTKLFTK